MRNDKIDPLVNPLKEAYMELEGKVYDQNEILKRDVTELLDRARRGCLRNKELWNCAIRGQTGSGKSTVALAIHKENIEDMRQYGLMTKEIKHLQQYLYEHIMSDQSEYLRYTMKQEENTHVVIDEFSSLNETGLNATTEKAQYEENSNLFAQRYVHKTSCSPSYIQDKNAWVILDVIGKDVERGYTRVKVSYRDVVTRNTLLIGHADIYIGEVIKEEFYAKYRKKKFARLSLLDKYGIRDVRELEYSRIIQESYNELKDVCTLIKLDAKQILVTVGKVKRKYKMQYSLYALNYIVMSVEPLLSLKRKIAETEQKANKIKEEWLQKRIKQELEVLKGTLGEALKEEERKINIEKEYRSIE